MLRLNLMYLYVLPLKDIAYPEGNRGGSSFECYFRQQRIHRNCGNDHDLHFWL